MTDPSPTEVFAMNFSGLAREVAMDIFPLETILEVHRLSNDEWEKINAHPKFQQMVHSMTIEWNSAQGTRERVKVKAATGLESKLESLINEIDNADIPLTQRVEAGKFLARIGELDTTNILGGSSGGSGVAITLNIGNVTRKIEGAIPMVIEHEEG
jgi:hypothetical protein